jgi:hypothetical protein
MPSTGFRRRADLSGVFRISDRSVLVMSAEAAGSVEAGVGAVGVDVDLDPRLDGVGPQRAFGDLQFQRPVGHAIVVHDLPLLLHAQDLVEIDARNGRESRAFAGRIDGEAGVVGGQIDPADEGVGRLGRGDPRKPDPGVKPGTVLQRLEGPLRASSGKGRREGRPSLDGLCGEKAPIGSTPSCSSALATWVGEPRSISPALVVSEIVAAPVGVEAHRQAVLRKHLAQRPSPDARGNA